MTTTDVGTELVLTERHDGVLTIIINRPAQKNAVNREVAVGVASALDELDSDPSLSVGVLTGARGTFSAGMDLKAFANGQTPILPGRGFGGVTQAVVRKPLIAAVEGWALGGGFEMALGCDLIVAAEDAKFGLPEVKRGLIAGEGGVIRLPRRIPYHVALKVLLTGEPLSAVDAKQYGLVSELTASGAALAGARELAQRIAANAPLALARVKEVLRETQGLNDAEAFKRQAEDASDLLHSEDAHEGALAFAEKRAPVWRGR
ncbi:crotonase/enoyl-CoA hydratase family protein [Mycobacterium sp.]|jgi:enoyl-CoA hydratase|uniref:crotonase/enoyl-CoA hydratase family protein n=1 Tax=Mycobacterium sp. TaxID=1785 RepID=UPI003F81466E